jgi:hypothetical protein
MGVISSHREFGVIAKIIEEVRELHIGLEVEHLVEIVVHEAQQQGIHPDISAPIARQMI